MRPDHEGNIWGKHHDRVTAFMIGTGIGLSACLEEAIKKSRKEKQE
jgi:hypothetical protein